MAKPIKIEIIGDDKSIRRAFGNVDSGLGKLLGPLATLGGAIAGAFAVDKIAGFGGEIVTLATNLGNVQQKVSTVFGSMSDEVATWADGLNEAFGVTGTQVQLMAANVADLLKPMGFSTEAATKMSQEMVGLAPALAQWSGGVYDAAQVSEILSKALLGERDQLKALGISINQAEVDARALQVAQKAGRDEANAMDEALATQQLIFEKSTDAQNGYTASTDTLTGQQNLLKARLAELKEEIATKLTPWLLKAGKYLVENVGPAFDKVRAAAVRVSTWFRETLVPIFTNIARKVGPALSEALDKTITVLREGIDWLREHKEFLIGFGVILAAMFAAWAVGAAAAAISTLAAAAPIIALGVAIGALAVLFKKAYEENEGFREGVDKVADFLKNRLWPAIKDVGGWIRDNLIPIIVDVAEFIADWSLKIAQFAIDAVSYTDDIYNGISDFVTKLWDIGTQIFEAIIWPYKAAYNEIYDILVVLGLVDGPKKATSTISKGGGGGRTFGSGGGGGATFGSGGAGGRSFGNRPTKTGFAWGGDVLAAGSYPVGERGREMVFLPQGARVQPAHAGGRGGDTFHIYAPNATPAQVANEIAWKRRIGNGR